MQSLTFGRLVYASHCAVGIVFSLFVFAFAHEPVCLATTTAFTLVQTSLCGFVIVLLVLLYYILFRFVCMYVCLLVS